MTSHLIVKCKSSSRWKNTNYTNVNQINRCMPKWIKMVYTTIKSHIPFLLSNEALIHICSMCCFFAQSSLYQCLRNTTFKSFKVKFIQWHHPNTRCDAMILFSYYALTPAMQCFVEIRTHHFIICFHEINLTNGELYWS